MHILIRAAWAFGLAALLSFSGNIDAQAEPAIAPQPCAEPGTLTMRVWDAVWAGVIQQSIDAWVETYCPGAQVTLEVVEWNDYWPLLREDAANGTLPDIFNVSQDRFYAFAESGALLDLQPYWDQFGVDTTLWGTGMVDPYRWGENRDLYAGPVNWDTIVVYYNKDLFEAAGVAYPTPAWTWDDFAAVAAALTNPAWNIFGAAVYSEYQAGYPNFIASTGIPPIIGAARTQCTLNQPRALAALNFLKGLYDAGYMPDVSTIGGPSADSSFNFWLNGRVAMVTNGSWNLPRALDEAAFDWDVVTLPRHPDTGRSRSILHSVGYVGAAQSANRDLAANLILYLVSDEGSAYFASAGGVAPANPTQQQVWVESFGQTEVNIQAFVDAIDDSQGVTVFDAIWEAINTDIVIDIFEENQSVVAAVDAACAAVDQALAAAQPG
ncbi:MAG: sugar ABC transporter substrate-binding protein [bacterium]|nr:sugar ABC transporter substrate-binding protein [bacterium]